MLEDTLQTCVMEFPGSWDRYIALMEFSYNNSYQSSIGMELYEALFGRRCRTLVCWTTLNEHKVIGPNIVKDTEDKVQVIRLSLKVASDQNKSYIDLKMKDIEYEVFLKVSPWRKVLRFGKQGKLSPRFISLSEVIQRIELVAYRLALPLELANLHDVFHVFMLRRYRSDESHILLMQEVQVNQDYSYDEEPKAILAREVKQLRNKQVPLVKVLWKHYGMEETTWESEATMRTQYPHLFYSSINFKDEILVRGREL